MSRYLLLFLLLTASAVYLGAQATSTAATPTPKTSGALLQLALTQNDIDVEGLKPWELKATFQLYDEKGKPTETASLDEIWVSPKQQKRTWTSPSFNQVEIVNEQGIFRSGNSDEAPLALDQARRSMVHPMPAEGDVRETQPIMQKKRFDTLELNCIMPTPLPTKGYWQPRLGSLPTYCFDLNNPIFRIGYIYGDTVSVANTVGTFQGRYIATKDLISINNVKNVDGKIDDLRILSTLNAQMFVPSTDAVNIGVKPVMIGPAVAAEYLISSTTPMYPTAAKIAHAEGTVVMGITIGVDGRVHSVHLLRPANPDLALAATGAASKRRYRPYLVNGVPTEVQTTITTDFNMVF
ncbi:MAG TPA: energy transducer TonB [Pseudomonas sp.]|uniref:energy transducer TonB n=1 Tax=Pseudomonas sp. TaxID=306 RepID=UPI002EDBA606